MSGRSVSLVVPLQDEELSIDTLVDSIAAQTRPPDEVVFVDAGSRDGTRVRLRSRRLPPPMVQKLVEAERVYPGVARNLGIAAAAHDWIALTDAGIRLDEQWLEELLRALDGSPAEVVCGAYEPVCDTFLRRCAALAYVPPPGPQGIRGPSVTSMLVRRDVFVRAGGFSPHRAAEDLIFFESLQQIGAVARFAPTARARWFTADTLGQTLRRFRLYSFHNLTAGRGRRWHRGVARLYALTGVAGAVAYALNLGFLALGVWPGLLAARAVDAAWRKRGTLPFETLSARHLVGAAGLLGIIDVATLAGYVLWLARGRPILIWRGPSGGSPDVRRARGRGER